jgi:hypothetical protein
MHALRVLGLCVTGVSVAGYAAGVWVAYPGRAFSVAGVMVGLALAAIGGSG